MKMPDTFDLIMTVSANVLKNDIGEVCFTCNNAKELVHCKDCTYRGDNNWCVLLRRFSPNEGFCHLAKKEDAEDE